MRSSKRVAAAALLMFLIGLALPACGPRKVRSVPELATKTKQVPTVLIPGITGSRLRDTASGKTVWGTTGSLFGPHDSGHSVALPVGGGENGLEAYEAITHFRLWPFRVEFYGIWQRTLEDHGFVTGDLARPTAEASFFFFPYDWRYPNARSARELVDRLAALRRARGEHRLTVDLICQSNAARIIRWMLRYGGATLEEAEAGKARPPEWLDVRNVFFVGPDNGGSLKNLRDLDRGRRYVPLVGRRFRPEVIFTLPSVFEGLPANGGRRFVDADGERLDVDLYDPDDWVRHGWSVFSEEARRRLDRNGRSDLFGDEEARLLHLRDVLERARRFQRLLTADPPGFRPPPYHLMINGYVPTPRHVLLEQRKGRWRVSYPGDRRVDRDRELAARIAAPGDGHAVLASQWSLSDRERAVVVHPAIHVDARHRDIVRQPEAIRYVLRVLAH